MEERMRITALYRMRVVGIVCAHGVVGMKGQGHCGGSEKRTKNWFEVALRMHMKHNVFHLVALSKMSNFGMNNVR
jgi:hypothetical protein